MLKCLRTKVLRARTPYGMLSSEFKEGVVYPESPWTKTYPGNFKEQEDVVLISKKDVIKEDTQINICEENIEDETIISKEDVDDEVKPETKLMSEENIEIETIISKEDVNNIRIEDINELYFGTTINELENIVNEFRLSENKNEFLNSIHYSKVKQISSFLKIKWTGSTKDMIKKIIKKV